jgi:hypothetical protein
VSGGKAFAHLQVELLPQVLFPLSQQGYPLFKQTPPCGALVERRKNLSTANHERISSGT